MSASAPAENTELYRRSRTVHVRVYWWRRDMFSQLRSKHILSTLNVYSTLQSVLWKVGMRSDQLLTHVYYLLANMASHKYIEKRTEDEKVLDAMWNVEKY